MLFCHVDSPRSLPIRSDLTEGAAHLDEEVENWGIRVLKSPVND
jgi:hypothetical protein